MKSVYLIIFSLLAIQAGQSQDAEDAVKEAARSVLSDERLQEMFRAVKENPAAAAKQVQENAGQMAKEASTIINDQLSKQGTSLDAEAGKAMESAARKLPRMGGSGTAAPAPQQTTATAPPAKPATTPPATSTPPAAPTVPPQTALPPATRSAAAEAARQPRTVTPVPAGTLAPQGGIIQMKQAAQPIARTAAPPPPASGVYDAPIVNAAAAPGNVPPPQPLTAKYGTAPQVQDKLPPGHMEIRARESEMDEANNLLTFSGNVLVNSPDDGITIKCEKLQIFLIDEDAKRKDVNGEDANIEKVLATGGLVEVKRMVRPKNGKPKVQTALARSVNFNYITKDVLLSGGPPFLQDGDSMVKTHSPSATITMKKGGAYTKIDDKERVKIRVPIKGGKKMSEDISSGGGIGLGL